MLHVLEDHDERVALHADAVELDDVLVLEVGQQLGLAVEVLASVVAGILQRLRGGAEGQNQPISDEGHQREGCLEEERLQWALHFLGGKESHRVCDTEDGEAASLLGK